jgi:uncharacterized protein (TIGR03000 family)
MFNSMLLWAKTGVLALAVLLFAAGPSLAQRGHSAHAGGHGHAGVSHVGHARIGGAHIGHAGMGRAHYGVGRYGQRFAGGRHYAGLGYRNARGYGGWGRGYGGWGGGYGDWGRGYGGWGGYGDWGWNYPYYYGNYWPDYGAFYPPYTYAPDYWAPAYTDTPTAIAPAPYYQPFYPAGAAASAYNDNEASIDVLVPVPDAKLWFNGQPTAQAGLERYFVTRPLTAGQSNVYEVRAMWMVNGQAVVQTQQIQVQPGQETIVRFPR